MKNMAMFIQMQAVGTCSLGVVGGLEFIIGIVLNDILKR